MSNKELFASEVPCSANPITYNKELCIGCNSCTNACPIDVLVPSEVKGQSPVVMYPVEGAIHLEHPLINRTKFVPVK